MDISVETFLKPNPESISDTVGQTRLSVSESTYLELVELEETLKDRTSRELMVAVDDHAIDVRAPRNLGSLREQQVRIFLDGEGQAGHFHLVAKRSSDGALVYTEPTMIRLLAV